MRKKSLCLCLLALCLLLCACGGAKVEPVVVDGNEYRPDKTTELTAALTEETVSVLDELPNLERADLSGSSCLGAIRDWAKTHPEVAVTYTVPVRSDLVVTNDTVSLDLSAVPRAELDEALLMLEYLPALQAVELGALEEPSPAEALQRQFPALRVGYTPTWRGQALDLNQSSLDLRQVSEADAKALLGWLPMMGSLRSAELGSGSAETPPIPWETLAEMQKAAPQADFHYSFTLYGKELTLQDTELDLNHIYIADQGALVKAVTACMPALSYLDMDFCGVDDEYMAEIRDNLPNTEVVWRVWFGTGYTVRTDTERILASNPGIGGELCPENTVPLKYCTRVKHLDLGHNSFLGNLDFCNYMPELETLVIALSDISDLSPLANCPHLRYAELQTSALNDLRPLANCHELHDLNICYNFSLTDITPLYGLTNLDRLWIGCLTPIPAAQIEEIRQRLPDCTINTKDLDPTREEWRWDGEYDNGMLRPSAAYERLREEMEYDRAPYSYSYIRNDPLYAPHGQGDNTTPPTWFTTQVPIPVDYTVY